MAATITLDATQEISEILAEADEKFENGDALAGSSLIWQAAKKTVKNVAKRRGLPAETNDDLSLIVCKLDAEYGYNMTLIASYGITEIFKEHVIHDILDDWEIEEYRELVNNFFEYMHALLPEQR